MLYADLEELTERLARIMRAIELAIELLDDQRKPLIESALRETVWEGVRLGHELTRRIAEDTLWAADLPVLCECWHDLADHARMCAFLDDSIGEAAVVASDMLTTLDDVRRAADAVDTGQVLVTAHPRDREAEARVRAGIAELEGAADRAFMAALGDDQHGRLDAAMALLTSCAARGARERTLLARHRG